MAGAPGGCGPTARGNGAACGQPWRETGLPSEEDRATATIPYSIVPFWATALFSLGMAALFLTFSGTYWGATARVYARCSIAGAVMWAVYAAMVGTRNPASVEWWGQFVPAVMFSAMAGLIEAELQTVARVPKWYVGVWILAACGMAIFLVPGVHLAQPLHQVPDGYLMTLPVTWTVLVRWPTFIIALVVGLAVLIRHIRRVGLSRRVLVYLVVGAVLSVSIFNDLVWVQHHPTLYPTSWMAGLFVLGVMWYQLHREVRRVARQLNQDSVTGARSRAAGEAYAASRLRTGPLGVVLCDVDGFKQINDALGHAAGDHVLRHVVECLGRHCGPDDWVVRLGGDEFLVVLPGCAKESAAAIAAQLSDAASGSREATGAATVSLSAGWAWSGPEGEWSELLSEADRKMYAEKGRHRARPVGDRA